jgi:hypothetical protein
MSASGENFHAIASDCYVPGGLDDDVGLQTEQRFDRIDEYETAVGCGAQRLDPLRPNQHTHETLQLSACSQRSDEGLCDRAESDESGPEIARVCVEMRHSMGADCRTARCRVNASVIS